MKKSEIERESERERDDAAAKASARQPNSVPGGRSAQIMMNDNIIMIINAMKIFKRQSGGPQAEAEDDIDAGVAAAASPRFKSKRRKH